MNKQSNDILAKVARYEAKLPDSNLTESADEDRTFQAGKIDLLKEQITDVAHYRDLRSKYASRVFGFMWIWAAFVLVILLIRGFFPNCFTLSDVVLTTLVGGTTISVVGLVGFMMQGLFHSNNSKKR